MISHITSHHLSLSLHLFAVVPSTSLFVTVNTHSFFFFFNDPAPTEISPLSLPDALPISCSALRGGWDSGATSRRVRLRARGGRRCGAIPPPRRPTSCSWGWASRSSIGTRWTRRSPRSEEHTSELQSQSNIVCRLLLGKKK